MSCQTDLPMKGFSCSLALAVQFPVPVVVNLLDLTDRQSATAALKRISERDGLNGGLVSTRPGNSTGDRDRKANQGLYFTYFLMASFVLKKRKKKDHMWKVGWLPSRGSCR